MADLTLKARVEKIEYWRNGNGTKGAAEKLEDHEERISCIEMHNAKEEVIIGRAIKKAIKEHNSSLSGIVRSLSPYVALIAWAIYLIVKGSI